MFDHTAPFTHLLRHTSLRHIVHCVHLYCSVLCVLSVWRNVKIMLHASEKFSCWVALTLPLSQVVGEVLLSHLTRAHTQNRWIPPATAARKTTHLLPVDIMLRMKLYSWTFICYTERHNELWLNIHCSSFKMHIWLQMKPRYGVKFSFVMQKDVICWREPRLQEKTAVRLKFSHALAVWNTLGQTAYYGIPFHVFGINLSQ